jgi:hypothetical protein
VRHRNQNFCPEAINRIADVISPLAITGREDHFALEFREPPRLKTVLWTMSLALSEFGMPALSAL